jgi:undecaprenyl-diphosphatase
MPLLWVAVVLGIVEGVTEFLPVSSTGHLILVERLLPSVGAHRDSFRVVIQVGAIAAVAWLYRGRFAALARPAEPGRFGGTRGLLLLALATIPALVVGYALRESIRGLATPGPVAAALAAGGLALLALERYRGDRGTATVDALTPAASLGIGLFQCLALWPGVSRSAATIAGGMLLGLSRRAAAEFSFLAAVPVLVVASGYEAWRDRDALTGQNLVVLLVGLAVSAASAVLAVRAFTAFLARSTMVPFAWYRIALAAAVALTLWL